MRAVSGRWREHHYMFAESWDHDFITRDLPVFAPGEALGEDVAEDEDGAEAEEGEGASGDSSALGAVGGARAVLSALPGVLLMPEPEEAQEEDGASGAPAAPEEASTQATGAQEAAEAAEAAPAQEAVEAAPAQEAAEVAEADANPGLESIPAGAGGGGGVGLAWQRDFFLKEPLMQKGVHCRLGMPGVTAAAHYDGGRNMVALIRCVARGSYLFRL